MYKINKIIVLSLLLSASSMQAASDWTTGLVTGIIGTLAVQTVLVATPLVMCWRDQAKKAQEQSDKEVNKVVSDEEKHAREEVIRKAKQESELTQKETLSESKSQEKGNAARELKKESVEEVHYKRLNDLIDQIVQ